MKVEKIQVYARKFLDSCITKSGGVSIYTVAQ